MIDYEKLKYVHELWDKLNIDCLTMEYRSSEHGSYYFEIKELSILTYDIDGLIKYLEEKVSEKIKSKYEIGQEVWYLKDEYEPHFFYIESIDYDSKENEYIYDCGSNLGSYWLESQLYASKYDLIKAQLDYWSHKLKVGHTKMCCILNMAK